MAVKDVSAREKLHQLVDEMPGEELHAAERYLEFLRNKSVEYLRQVLENAPVDDEPLTEEDRAALAEADAELARGEGIAWEEARDRLMRGEKCPGS